MAVDATLTTPAPAAASVTGAIQKASRLTGTNFQYLLAAAKVESNLDPNAAAKTSSAGGLFQFIEQTWLGTLKEAGPSFGYGRYASAISRTASGRFVVSDPAMRREVMQLRQDPTANAIMAGVFTNSNAAYLTKKLGRAPSEGELYIAHFLGAGGAAKLISQAAAAPGARAADAFPAAARANRSIFFNKDGRARNFAEVTQKLTGRFQVARARQAPSDEAAASPQRTAYAAETARVARAYERASPKPADRVAVAPVAAIAVAAKPVATEPVAAVNPVAVRVAAANPGARPAENEPVFHNPYRAQRPQPVASVVSERWITRSAVPSSPVQAAAPTPPPATTPPPPAPTPNEVVQSSHANLRPRYTPRSDDPPIGQPQSDEPLGLFQDMRPNVRALFTGG